MGKLIAGLLIGLIVGAAITFFTFVGVPKAAGRPGVPIKAPDAAGMPGSAEIVLKQDFFNEILLVIFRDMNAPAFPLNGAANAGPAAPAPPGGCDSTIKLLGEGSGVRTGLDLTNNTISAPLAFTGSYDSMLGCFPFTGWAQTTLELRYDESQRKVLGNLNVETVNLDGVNPIISSFVTPMVQTTINNRVNPIQILQGDQIAINMPLASTGSALKADVKDVRAEVKDNALHMFVNYGFSGAPLQ